MEWWEYIAGTIDHANAIAGLAIDVSESSADDQVAIKPWMNETYAST